ncbi:MAG: adenylosuccinate synthase [Gemmatimonadota bacterium]|nr:adenylosuccinate synthase [Gemmatimonadota bacterium]MDE2984741.1 adenylosuccinate synthase [Gemmatimonadota bacterium]
MGARAPSGACTVIVGCQWGDEGKGKVVDVLAGDVDVIARYQGGANAGHTVHVGEHHIVLHQVPSGVLHPEKRCLLGNGVVLDVDQFFGELDGLASRGVDAGGRIGISTRAHVVFPYHKALDVAAEAAARLKIGTTGRGIGPAYEAKTGRRGVRIADLLDRARGADRVGRGIEWARERLRQLGADPDSAGTVEESLALSHRLPAVATDVGDEIARALAAGKRVLLEGAQGTALDVDHGTYPYVTSSNTTAGAAAVGAGIGPTAIDSVVGVVKAYTTRVGNGPLPSAFDAEMDERIRELGAEFGATTGRPRRCGWFDAVLAAYSARVNGLTGIAVTKLDVLDTLPELKIATGYRIDGDTHSLFPACAHALGRAEPVYEIHPGWGSPTTGARTMSDLPANARAYLHRIEELVGAPIVMVSVGTRRSQVILET